AVADPQLVVSGLVLGGITLGTVAALVVYHLMTASARARGTEPVPEDEEQFEASEAGRLGGPRPRASRLAHPRAAHTFGRE
ncbi:hypothetical protein R0J91_20755, partial [Micrococcus sp. SIMBA_131]